MLIFRGLYVGLRKEKIQGTYFKICALYFEICPTYFDASAKVMKILHHKIVCIWSVFSKSVDELPANYCKLFCITLDFRYI